MYVHQQEIIYVYVTILISALVRRPYFFNDFSILPIPLVFSLAVQILYYV